MKFRLFLILFSVFFPCLSHAYDGATDPAAWTELKSQVEGKQAELAALMGQVEQAGLSTDYAYVSKVVIERFLGYAQYDRDNQSELQEALDAVWWNHKVPDQDYVVNLPFDELQGCIEVADFAMAELRAQLDEAVVLNPPVDFSTGAMRLGEGSFTREGEPVFPSTFTWMPDAEDLMQAFGRMGGVSYALTDLNADGTVKQWAIDGDIEDVMEQGASNQAFQQFFIGHRAPSWMSDANPEVLDGGRNFVTYDTDSPIIRENFTKLFTQYIPPVTTAAGEQQRMHLLANEPNFATRKDGWQADKGVSENTMNRYRDWLESKYETVQNLNDIYGTSYVSFDAARDAMTMPIDPEAPETIQGGPVWYDWCRFNMDRINDFFLFLKTGAQGNDPLAAPTTIKVLGPQLSDDWRDEGIDLEYLADLMDVTGADLHSTPLGMSNMNVKEGLEWMEDYAMDWREQAMFLDFYKSLHPEKAYYDSEWHGLSTGRWRDFAMDRDYVRSSIWLGFTHGMNAIQSWVWSRKEDGNFLDVNSDFLGEILTQPTALDAYGRVMKELNAHAKTITTLAKANRQFYIFYCEESAIQDLEYIHELETVYEALKLLNLRVGFTTPSRIDGLDPESQTVFVSPSQFMEEGSLAGLKTFNQEGGNIVLVDAAHSFLKDELGRAREGGAGFTPFASVDFDTAETMADELDSVLDPVKPEQAVSVGITDLGTSPAYGILATQSIDAETGNVILSLVNVSQQERTVHLQLETGKAPTFTNLLTGKETTTSHVMQPCDLLLLSASTSVIGN